MECAKCHRPIESGAYTLLPDNSTAFHRQCFTCAICDLELPVQYVSVDNRFMHQQCYVDKLAARCLKCHMPTAPDEVVFNLSPSSSSAAAESKVIHQRCFVCAKCGRALDGKYFERDEAFYDGGCYTELFAPRCGRCGKAIATSQPFQKFQSSSFHSECFTCSTCDRSLAGVRFKPLLAGESKFECEHCVLAKKKAPTLVSKVAAGNSPSSSASTPLVSANSSPVTAHTKPFSNSAASSKSDIVYISPAVRDPVVPSVPPVVDVDPVSAALRNIPIVAPVSRISPIAPPVQVEKVLPKAAIASTSAPSKPPSVQPKPVIPQNTPPATSPSKLPAKPAAKQEEPKSPIKPTVKSEEAPTVAPVVDVPPAVSQSTIPLSTNSSANSINVSASQSTTQLADPGASGTATPSRRPRSSTFGNKDDVSSPRTPGGTVVTPNATADLMDRLKNQLTVLTGVSASPEPVKRTSSQTMIAADQGNPFPSSKSPRHSTGLHKSLPPSQLKRSSTEMPEHVGPKLPKEMLASVESPGTARAAGFWKQTQTTKAQESTAIPQSLLSTNETTDSSRPRKESAGLIPVNLLSAIRSTSSNSLNRVQAEEIKDASMPAFLRKSDSSNSLSNSLNDAMNRMRDGDSNSTDPAGPLKRALSKARIAVSEQDHTDDEW
eukprot:Partr_v1_DN27344_c1_g1_i1_m45910 putative four and A half lim domains